MGAESQQGSQGGSQTEQVPRKDWGRFLDQFSEMNAETTVRVEVVGAEEMGTPLVSDDMPLLAVTLDDAAGPAQVIIECGDTAGGSPASFRHIVQDPTAIWARQAEDYRWDALEIESRSGSAIISVNPHPGRGDLGLKEAGRSEVRVP